MGSVFCGCSKRADNTMGNSEPASAGDRGAPLGRGGSGASQSSAATARARAARGKLVTEKRIGRRELERRERIIGIVEGTAVDAEPGSYRPPDSSSSASKKRTAASTASVVATVDPSTTHGKMAAMRMEAKMKKSREKAMESKRGRTADLLFGDGLKETEFVPEVTDVSTSRIERTPKKAAIAESDLFVSGTSAAEAAMARMASKKGTEKSMAERRERTKQLLHGDELRDTRAVEATMKSATDSVLLAGLPPAKARVQQALLNLQNLNAHGKVPATAKVLRKIITNLLSAETIEAQEKVGKLRLSNKKIRGCFVDLIGGMECLQSLGFSKKMLAPDIGVAEEEFMVFDFASIDKEALWHCITLIDLHYPAVP